MILTGDEIRQEHRRGRIVIDPFSDEQVNPNSYNYRLGTEYIELRGDQCIDPATTVASSTPISIPESGMTLHPGRVYLCNTRESLGSTHYVTSLIGKSSMGRLGLFLQISADLGHQGEIHKWTLELTCSTPIKIYPLMIIGQVTFWRVQGEYFQRAGYYGAFDAPTQRRSDERGLK
jgi:dCTP deaminase